MFAALVIRGASLLAPLLAIPSPQSAAPDANPPSSKSDDAAKPKKTFVPGPPWVLPDWPAITFKEVAKASGIDMTSLVGDPEKPRLIDTLGCGMSWFDYDGDGWLDLFIPNGSTLDAVVGKATNTASDKLFRNRGDGTFEDVTEKAGLKDDRWGFMGAAGDYDNDGDTDLYVANFGPGFLYRNNGDGTFTDVAAEAGVQFGGVTPGASWGDIDLDGDLDLYVAAYVEFNKKNPWPRFAKTMRNMKVMLGPQGLTGAPDRLYRNEGGGKFTDVSKEAGLRTTEKEHGFTIQILDMNEDGVNDIFVANDMTPNHHYRAVKPGKFTPCASDSGLGVDHEGVQKGCMGVALADLNDDLLPDIYITNFAAQTKDLYVSLGDNMWDEDPSPLERARTAIPFVGWGTGFFDFDLDGDEDLVAFNGHVYPQVDTERPRVQDYRQLPLLFRRDGPLRFADVAKLAGTDFNAEHCIRGSGFADYDEDGDVDIANFDMDAPAILLRNDTPKKGAFLRVQLLGTTINRDAYGSRIVLEAAGRRHTRWVLGQGSFISQNDPRGIFGLGLADKVDRITVRWTGGKDEVVEGPFAVDRTIVIKEGTGKVGEIENGKVWTRAMTQALEAGGEGGGAGK